MTELFERYLGMTPTPLMRVVLILIAATILALIARLVVFRLVLYLARKTTTTLDDRIAELVRGPVLLTLILGGVMVAIGDLHLPDPWPYYFLGVIKTVLILYLGGAVNRIGALVLEALSEQLDRFKWIQPKTLPLMEMVMKVLVFAAVIYLIMSAWEKNLTSWLASAGVVGIAVGFAAKDTLANLFAGVFILADSPYKVGDFIILDNGVRGMVTDIGIRSTRVLTRDDVEVTVPNAVIGNAKIINETSGPHEKMRMKVKITVSYGSDAEQVRAILLACADGVPHVAADPEPSVRFREFGESGLLFELRVWVDEPVYHGRVLDAINRNVYNAFAEASIEIPYPRRELYVKQMPDE